MKDRLVCGVGINDADYPTRRYKTVNGKSKLVWTCPFWRKWKDMISRCYSERELEKYPTYKGCSVCEDWLYFSRFKAWMEKQAWEGLVLDKDYHKE